MSHDREEDRALNHLTCNVKKPGRKKEIAKHPKNDQARRKGASKERVMPWKASEDSISRRDSDCMRQILRVS